jgi:glycosyltransferase involved in cell wall biosynthesis
VVTIHDLSYRLVPDAHLGVLRHGMRLLVPLAARRSHRVIVDAASTRDDLRRLLKIGQDKVDVVPLGLGSPRLATPLPESKVRTWLEAGDRPIVLCVAAKRPHKNILRLIGAVAMLPAQRRPLLVLPGYRTAHEEDLKRRAFGLGVANDIRFLGWVDPEQLEGLYGAASCFVFPSLLEGFGLPVVEAMARGVPVACSARGSLAEVAGDAALIFDPESEAAIAAAIERVLSDRDTTRRLRAAGLQQASKFTWAATAAGTIACYERTLGNR